MWSAECANAHHHHTPTYHCVRVTRPSRAQWGLRTKYEWTALMEDCDKAVKNGTLKYRPTCIRLKFESFEEEVSE